MKEIAQKENLKANLESQKEQITGNIEAFDCNPDLKVPINEALYNILSNSDNVAKTRIVKKLNSLYYGRNFTNNDHSDFCIKSDVNSFINLSDHQLTNDEIEFLNLGLNCHIEPKYEKLLKETELEALYQTLLQLESKKTIVIKPDLAIQLKSESTKHRNTKHPSIITPALRQAARNLKSNPNIVIRKADKSSIYVIMNKTDYITKLNILLNDDTKFKRINKDPTNSLKQRANKLIEVLNAAQDDIKLSKIIGDYNPGYVYGNVKTHKENNPLRPIISQIPTPTYNLAKSLNNIISPYLPQEFTLKSTNDFIDLLHSNQCNGIIASLDVESLFTNVPIDPTIQIIIEHSYNHPTIPPPKIPSEILRQLLELCTKEAPFRCPEGKLYLQIEGVAMGSPLGPTFANFYMGDLEKRVFEDPEQKPVIYARYVDDIFVQIESEAKLIALKQLFQSNSALNFTYELNVNNKLPFLDILVDTNNNTFHTTVYHKPTDHGKCLNANSECVSKYKNSVITNYLNRAYKVSSSWPDFHNEVMHIKQKLVNNNYSNNVVDAQIKIFLQKKLSTSVNQEEKRTLIPIYYQSQTHLNYKIEERAIKNIVLNNSRCSDPDKKLNIVFYYKNIKSANLVMRNNMAPPPSTLQQTNVVYLFQCPLPHSQAETYVGLTQTTLSRRLTMHGQDGSIYKHFVTSHSMKPSREQLTENTSIIAKASDRYKLLIKEALLIMKHSPSINKQYDNFTNILKLHAHRNSTSQNLPTPSALSVLQLPPSGFSTAPSAPPLDESFINLRHAPLDSPLHNTDTELNPNSNALPFSPSAPPLQTTPPFDNNTPSTAPHLLETKNLHNYPQNNPFGHPLQPHNPINELTSSFQQKSIVPSPTILHKPLDMINETDLLPTTPPSLSTSTIDNNINSKNSILQNAGITEFAQHDTHATNNVYECSPRRLRSRRQ